MARSWLPAVYYILGAAGRILCYNQRVAYCISSDREIYQLSVMGKTGGVIMRKNLGANPYVYPRPVLIVAAYGEDGAVDAMNVAYGGIVNSNRIQINIGVRHKTSDNIKLRNAFTVGIADEENLVAADYVAIVSGHDVPDKIEKSGFHTVKSEFVDAPVIEELPISLECKVEEINQYNATLRIVAEIVNVSVDEKILDGDGKIDPEKLHAISYDPANHTYLRVGGKAGIAFSDGNKLK